MRPPARQPEAGVVLVNVLVVLAIAGGLVVLLLARQDAALDRVASASDAAVAEQIALGAEASVVDALKRDLQTAPEVDHLGEAWALSVVQEAVTLPTGTFSVAITDLQGRYDINQLADRTLGSVAFAQRLLAALDQPPEMADRIARLLQALGPVARLEQLDDLGIPPQVRAALAPHVTALPQPGTINLNSAGPLLLEVMMQNRTLALQLVARRERAGTITRETLREIGALRPQNSGFTSDVYAVDIVAEAGTARVRLVSTVVRPTQARAAASVIVWDRRLESIPAPAD